MIKYLYFVSYKFQNDIGDGWGNGQIEMSKRVESMADIYYMHNKLKEIQEDEVEKLIIINFILMSEINY